jgi:hypothetical protein
MSVKIYQPLPQSLHCDCEIENANGALDGAGRICPRSPVPFSQWSDLNRRNDLVVPPLGGGGEDQSGHRRKADSMPGAAAGSAEVKWLEIDSDWPHAVPALSLF